LNPEFLYPELSKQKNVFVSLMEALSTHLRPAPYPYGLLTLRLLGKLGGKNRRVLREPIDISHPLSFTDFNTERMGLDFAWSASITTGTNQVGMVRDESPRDSKFFVELPLQRCVGILRRASFSSHMTTAPASFRDRTRGWQDSEMLREHEIETLDLFSYCRDVSQETKLSQAVASLQLLRSSLTKIMSVEKGSLEFSDTKQIVGSEQPDGSRALAEKQSFDMQTHATTLSMYNTDFHAICLGLMFGCALDGIKEKELHFVKGLMTSVYTIVTTNERSIARVDANGSSLNPTKTELDNDHEETPEFGNVCEESLGSLKPFGYFEFNGPLRYTTDPLTINKALAEFLSEPSAALNCVGLDLLEHLLRLPTLLNDEKEQGAEDFVSGELKRGPMIFFESLLSAMCEKCLSSSWSRRDGLYKGICLMVETLGAAWGARYEVELMNVALFSVKSVPREMSIAGVRSFQFVIELCWKIYGTPLYVDDDNDGQPSFVFDLLSLLKNKDDSKVDEDQRGKRLLKNPGDEVLQMLICEMASTKQLSR
jgi:hypothetical protein